MTPERRELLARIEGLVAESPDSGAEWLALAHSAIDEFDTKVVCEENDVEVTHDELAAIRGASDAIESALAAFFAYRDRGRAS